MTKPVSLDAQVKGYFTNRAKSGATGLALLVRCIENLASPDRDWDALSRFVSLSKSTGQEAKVKMIIRAAFGNRLKYTSCAKHDTGGRFTIGWEGSFDLNASNTFGAIRQAVQQGKSWDDKAFILQLRQMFPVEKAKRQVSEEAKAKVVKHLKGYMDKLKADGFQTGEILAMLQKELAIQSMPAGTVISAPVSPVKLGEEPAF